MVTFRAVPMGDEPARRLVEAMGDAMAALYDGLVLDGSEMPTATPDELGPPSGIFLVGFDQDGAAVCCGGLKGPRRGRL